MSRKDNGYRAKWLYLHGQTDNSERLKNTLGFISKFALLSHGKLQGSVLFNHQQASWLGILKQKRLNSFWMPLYEQKKRVKAICTKLILQFAPLFPVQKLKHSFH